MKFEMINAEDYCVAVTDGTHDSPKTIDSEFYLITSRHLQEFSLDFENANTISKEDYDEINRRSRVEQYDILFSMIGTVGRIYIEQNDDINYAIKNVGLFKNGGDEIKAKWLYYYLQTPEAQNYIKQNLRGSTQQYIPLSSLRKFPIKIPSSFNYMKAIVKVLDDIDQKRKLNIGIISNLEQLAQTLFKRWFIDFEFPNENGEPYKSSGGKMVQSELGEIPEGWEIKSLDTIAHYENGLAMQKYRPDNEKESLPVLKIRELNQGYVDSRSDRCTKNIKESVKVYDGDVIFSWSGTLLVKIWFGGEAGLNQHLFKVTSKYYPKWFYYLWTKHYLERFINIASDKATTMGHIRRADLSDAKVFVPPDHLLKNFNKVFSPILDMIIIKGIEERKLSRLRDELLPKLLSGEIELPDESEVTEHV